jgi:hypothetical protein
VRQQFLQALGGVRRQATQHIAQVGERICPLPRSGRILGRILPNCHPIAGFLLRRESGKRHAAVELSAQEFTRHPAQRFLSYPASTPHFSALV